jgi:dimethylhistidine N-methyltransferase
MELGSGSASKTEILLQAILDRHGRARYLPVDVSESALLASARRLASTHPRLEVVAIAGDYEEGLRRLPGAPGPRLVAWLGSNIGNLERSEAAAFLGRLRRLLAPGDRILVGIDLRKDRAVLEAAYDDDRGVTARFNLNLLARINAELGGRFDLGAFRHRALYDAARGRVEMHLVSRRAQRVRIDALACEVALARGETIHTENSYKYSLGEIDALAERAALRVERRWLDARERFASVLLAA